MGSSPPQPRSRLRRRQACAIPCSSSVPRSYGPRRRHPRSHQYLARSHSPADDGTLVNGVLPCPVVRGRGVVSIGVLAVFLTCPVSAVAQEPQGPGPTVAATAENQFFPRSLTVPPNTTVYWENRGLQHNVKFEDGAFEQPADPLSTPWRVWRHFDTAGVFRYYCEAH